MLYERIRKEHERLKEKINKLQNQLQSFPDGNLVCCNHGTLCKWYHNNGHSRTYIPKSKRHMAEQLAIKKYLSCLLSDLTQEMKALDAYLHYHTESSKTQKLLAQPGYSELLAPYFHPLSQELSTWMQEDYPKNPSHPELLIHKTISGHLVRSKSEAMICHVLYTHQIPFRYECALYLNGSPFFPDFTIRHPKSGETYYWEHFGLMDDASYCKNMASKMQIYSTNNIIPSIQLITTYETSRHPLTIETIQKTVEYYFL
ncbi:MAG: ATPase [Brotaphodocola sp.]